MIPAKRKIENIKPVVIRNTVIGEGIPKICVPIVGRTREEILAQAEKITSVTCDVVEWRVDWYEHASDMENVIDILKSLREILGDTVLLMTFRTADEGGEKSIDKAAYAALNIAAARSGYVDLVDVEVFTGEKIVGHIIEEVHALGVKVIASNHDFEKTPDKDEIIRRLYMMQALGADIPKIAVMPRNTKDLLNLLSATEEMHSTYADRPIITMSMSGQGVLSRVCGEVFGSALTFGAVGKASAPGQMAADELETVLKLLHKAL